MVPSNVYSSVDGLVPGSSEGTGWFILLFLLWGCKPFSSLGTFSSSFIGDPVLSPMVVSEISPLYLSGSARASQETAISGFHQQPFSGIQNIIRVWWLYMGRILRWETLWMALSSISAQHFVSIFSSVSILFTLLRSTEASTLCPPIFSVYIFFYPTLKTNI